MKPLYININNEEFQSNDELEVLKHDLDSDFFFYLGEKIAKDCKVENENALITDFNTQDNAEDYQKIIAQWHKLKTILFSEECEGKFEFTLPNGYIHWLRYSEKYNHVYDKNFSHGEPAVITIDLEELYEDSVEDLQRKILRKLQRDDFYLEIDEIIFNDDIVTRKSPLICTIKEKYDDIGFKSYKKWMSDMSKTDTGRKDKETSRRNEIVSNTEDIFIVASDRMEKDETKWFSEFYTKDGKALSGTYELINDGISPFYFYDGNYYCINNCRLKKIALSECVGATVVDEKNAFFEYFILRNNSGTFVINTDGEILIPNGVYDEIKYAGKDCVLVQTGGLWGVVSLDNIVLIDFKEYEGITALRAHDKIYFSFKNEDGEVGVIDKSGDLVISPLYENIELLRGTNGSIWFKVTKNFDSYGIIDEYGNVVIPQEYDDIDILFDNYNEDRAKSLSSFFEIKKGDESGVVNSEGEFVIPLDSYDDLRFEENCICADYEDDYDIWEHEWKNPPIVYQFPDEFCVYDKNGLRVCAERPGSMYAEKQIRYLKNKKGRIVYTSYCDALYIDGYPKNIGDCYIEEIENEDYTKYNIIDSYGKVLGEIPEGFGVECFINGMALCCDQSKGEVCSIINLNGRIIKRLPKEERSYFTSLKEGKFYFVEDCGNIGYYDTNLSKTIICNNKDVKDLLDTMQEGVLYVKTQRGNLGLLNYYTGKLLEYEGLERIDPLTGPWNWNEDLPIITDYFLLRKNGKNTLIDKDGNIIIKKEFTLLDCIQPNK